MRIAVCEDNAAELAAICGCIEEYCKRNCYLNKIHRFTSGEALMTAFAPGEFDIIFLDIFLDGMSGVEAARKICEADPGCLLVFITISEDFTRESYSVDAISYIVKPVESGKIDHTLDKCRHEFHKNSRVIRVPAGYGETVDIPLRAIRYVEVCGKEVIFHLGKSTFTARNTVLEERTRSTGKLLQMQRTYYPLLREKISEAKTARHDLRHHLVTISGFLEKGQYDRLREYLWEYQAVPSEAEPVSYCQNEVADILAHYYTRLAGEHGITLSLKLDIAADIKAADADLCALLSNLLENAVEACLRQSPGERFITLSAKQKRSFLAIRMENSSTGTAQSAAGFLSSKGAGRTGYGLESIRAITRRYNGETDFQYDETAKVFTSIVTLETG